MKKKKRTVGRNVKKGIWQDSWDYLKETRNYIYIVVAIFFISALIAFLFPENYGFFDELLRGLADKIEGLSFLGLTWFILQNNVTSAFVATVLENT